MKRSLRPERRWTVGRSSSGSPMPASAAAAERPFGRRAAACRALIASVSQSVSYFAVPPCAHSTTGPAPTLLFAWRTSPIASTMVRRARAFTSTARSRVHMYPSRKHSLCSAYFSLGSRSCARAWHAHHDSIMTHAHTSTQTLEHYLTAHAGGASSLSAPPTSLKRKLSCISRFSDQAATPSSSRFMGSGWEYWTWRPSHRAPPQRAARMNGTI